VLCKARHVASGCNRSAEIVTSFQDAISKDPELPNAVAAIRALMLLICESEGAIELLRG
jgi:hypothetical protein